MWLLLWQIAPSLYPEDSTRYADDAARVQANNGRLQAIATTRAAMVAALAGLAAFGALLVNAINVRVGLRTLALEREGHVTDRYSKAVEQLGNEESIANRLGGIYALERIAEDSDRDHRIVVMVLSAFVREQTRDKRGTEPDEAARPATDVQAGLSVLARLPNRSGILRADLTRAHLQGANLVRAHLEGAVLHWAHLQGARLDAAHLGGARLDAAHLQLATLYEAHLEDAVLLDANLQGAVLVQASLQDALLGGAHLEDADLGAAHLEGAQLHYATGLTQEQVEAAYGDADTHCQRG